MPSPYSCDACSLEFSTWCMRKVLPNCAHIICQRCADKSSLCPLCRAPINGRKGSELSTDTEFLSMGAGTSSQYQDTCVTAHIIGHNWVSDMRQNYNLCAGLNVDLSFELITKDVIFEIIQQARAGKFQQHKNIVIFACIPLAWHVYRPPKFQNMTLFLPNEGFDSRTLQSNFIALMEYLTVHRPDTQLFIFLPPLLDANTFNKSQIYYSNKEFSHVFETQPLIDERVVNKHTKKILHQLHPKNFSDMPGNIHIINGHDIAMRSFSEKAVQSVNSYIAGSTTGLNIEECFINGVNPSTTFLSALYKSIINLIRETMVSKSTIAASSLSNEFRFGDFSKRSINSTNISPTNNQESVSYPSKSIRVSNNDIHQPTSNATGYLGGINNSNNYRPVTYPDSPPAMSVNNDIEPLPADDKQNLLDATREEILRSSEYIKTIRDSCYPSVTNDELIQVALTAVEHYFQ